MAQLIIRNMPDDIHRKLKMLAARKGKTMTALMIEAAGKMVNKGEGGQ